MPHRGNEDGERMPGKREWKVLLLEVWDDLKNGEVKGNGQFKGGFLIKWLLWTASPSYL